MARQAFTAKLARVLRDRLKELVTRPATISLVVPCYNVGRYLDDFTRSLSAQRGGLRNVEVIFVDDGSTDDTGEMIELSLSQLPYGTARVIKQANGGLCSARNAGLAEATGEWVSFPDPDDMLDPSYIATVRRALMHARRPALIVTRLVRFIERTGQLVDNHALTYRFRHATTERAVENLGEYIHLAANSAFYSVSALRKQHLTFDERIRPGFEDAHFTNRYLVRSAPRSTVHFLRRAKYIYRKRADETSLQDRAPSLKSYWLDQAKYGWLGLLEDAKAVRGKVPDFVQRTVLYDVSGHVRSLLDSPVAQRSLSDAEKEDYRDILASVMSHIDLSVLISGVRGLHGEYKVALIAAFWPRELHRTAIYISEWEPASRMVRVLAVSPSMDDSTAPTVDGKIAEKLWEKRIRRPFVGDTVLFEHAYWLRIGETLEFDEDFAIRIAGRSVLTNATPITPDLLDKLLPRSLPSLEGEQLWVLLDRADKADDNAEHLYRHLQGCPPAGLEIVFVLDPTSTDWPRLKADGFNLVAFGSDEHRQALQKATIVASSQGDLHIRRPFFDLLPTYRFVFLQHGVTSQDQSRWFNGIAPSLILAASRPEAASFVADDGRYRFTKPQVALAGFPRHDALLSGVKAPGSTIFIMPSWRKHLAIPNGNVWTLKPGFETSRYATHWREFLNSRELSSLATEKGLTLEFCPHPNFSPYAHLFNPPDFVTTINAKRIDSVQPHLQRCAIFITDYSSIAFDAAYAGKPIIYFQFDRSAFFGGDHASTSGYFDFDRDGFGPICETIDEMNSVLATSLAGSDPKYDQRRSAFFAHIDQSNCERATEAILDITRIRGFSSSICGRLVPSTEL